MSSTFGARVIGDEAAAKALAEQKGGGNVFGKRVVTAIPEPNTEAVAKKNSQFGPLVVKGSTNQDNHGKPGSVSVSEIERILGENPTFFDSLYEGELARPEGPRTDALEVFLNVEYGIKGAGRQSIIQEIKAMLGHGAITAKQLANDFTAQSKALDERLERQEENERLGDAARIHSLRQREDDLNALKGSTRKGTASQLEEESADTDRQKKAIAERDGLDIGDSGKPGEPILPAGVHNVVQGGREKGEKQAGGATASGTHTPPASTEIEKPKKKKKK